MRELEIRLASDVVRLVVADVDLEWRLAGDTNGAWHALSVAAANDATNALIDALSRATVGAGTLPDLFNHRGISLWQFLVSYVWPEIDRARELVVALDALVRDLRPTLVTAVVDVGSPSARIWRGAVSAVTSARGVPARFRRGRASVVDAKRFAFERALAGEAEIAIRQLRAARAMRPRRRGSSTGGVLYATVARAATPEPFGDGVWDEQLSPFLPELEADGWRVVAVDCPYGPRRGARESTIRRAAQVPSVDWRHFEEWFRPSRVGFRAETRALLADDAFRAACSVDDVSLVPPLTPTLRRMGTVIAAECAWILDSAARILDDLRPAAIVATYESGPYQRALIIEGARRGVPSIGLQHGMLFDDNYDYMHESIVPGGTGERGFVVPDVTCVWSDLWRESLVAAGSYPEAAVVVTGNWRHDRTTGDIVDARTRLGLDLRDCVALVLPPWPDPVGFVERCIEPCRAAGLRIVVKPHPGDPADEFETLLRGRGVHDGRVVDRLAEALVAADVVVTGSSTTIGESMLYDRPVVVHDQATHASVAFYVGEHACLHAPDVESLGAALRALTSDVELRERVVARGRAMAQRLFGPLDGRSGRRVADVVTSLARSAR